jgi:tRNA(Ile)-lysidine synthase
VHPLILRLKKSVRKYGMLRPGEKVVVAVSGGADSMALLYGLWEVREVFGLSLAVAHLDHGLRPEGEKETHFVRGAAAKLGVPFFHQKASVWSRQEEKGLTIQEAARDVRYDFLRETARVNEASKVALGHTADDQAETILMRFLRGSGARGLSGIPPVREGIFIRPFIEAWREEIESFLKQKKVDYLRDPSNRSDQYLRNRVRHDLLPLLRDYNPRIHRILVQMADLFRAEEEFWQELMKEKFPQVVRGREKGHLSLDVPSLVSQPFPLRLRYFRQAIEEVQGNLRRVHLPHILAIESLLENREPNKVIRLPQGLSVTKAYHALYFCRGEKEAVPFEHSVSGPGDVEIPEIGRRIHFELQTRESKISLPESPEVALLDFDDLEFPLTLRSFRPGDRIQPLGMEGGKKVKKLFIDSKIPASQRKRIPLLYRKDRLLWVAGVRIDHRARLKPGTRWVLRVELC